MSNNDDNKNQVRQLRQQIIGLVRDYHAVAFSQDRFIPGKSSIPCAGRVFDAEELVNLVESGLDFWLTTGRFAAQFEREFAKFFGARHALLTNSGSSANLLAVSALTSPKLGPRRLRPGDEVITVASAFPTTVNPLFQNRLVPVFVDVSVPTYNVDVSQLEAALSDRTRAMIFAHMMGNPFDLNSVVAFTRKHDLWLIEDCCDAVGSRYGERSVGNFGHLATFSFYPAHHITMGEGGCVLTGDPLLKTLVESFRDWGRDCWCDPGKENTCGKRFDWQLGDLPEGYDHKYIYSHIGYNMKLTDMQAAVGVAQLRKLPVFIQARKHNFEVLRQELRSLEEYFILPEATQNSDPSWFGFPIAVRESAPFTRLQAIRYLEANKIATRLLFGGNIIRQPAYENSDYRCIGDLKRADFVMNQAFWIGVYPGLSQAMLDFIIDRFHRMSKEAPLY
jgi:CDP-6-deoxy-D-xylo-4-hexulose-3-dehydrase